MWPDCCWVRIHVCFGGMSASSWPSAGPTFFLFLQLLFRKQIICLCLAHLLLSPQPSVRPPSLHHGASSFTAHQAAPHSALCPVFSLMLSCPSDVLISVLVTPSENLSSATSSSSSCLQTIHHSKSLYRLITLLFHVCCCQNCVFVVDWMTVCISPGFSVEYDLEEIPLTDEDERPLSQGELRRTIMKAVSAAKRPGVTPSGSFGIYVPVSF